MAPTIKNWTIVKAEGNMYLKGNVYNHPNKLYASNGDLILSTPIVDGGGGRIITTDMEYILEG